MRYATLTALSIGILLQGCSANYLNKTAYPYQKLPGWDSGDQIASMYALRQSCRVIIKDNDKRTVDQNWLKACHAILSEKPQTDTASRRLIEEYFTPYRLSLKDTSSGHFTGYYQPTLLGSPVKTSEYTVPIYKRPDSLIRKTLKDGNAKYGMMKNGRFVPYYSREEISDGNLFSKKDIIAWLPNRTERAFLQIQGSGRIYFPDGKSILVGYSAQNGHPYRPIGRALLEQKELPRDQITMQSIKEWLDDNPKKADEILDYDPSFVFFKVLDHSNPVGAQGVELTPKISLAVDWRFTRYGTPVWLNTTYETADGKEHELQKLMVAQDTGGAIRGPNRGDVFWGFGHAAEYTAGHMNSKGEMWVLLPK